MVIKVGENIAFLGKKKGLTQNELAKVFNISNQSVSKWEAGKCCPDIELLPQLASFFEISIDELLVGECLSKRSHTKETNDTIVLRAIKIAQENRTIYTALLQRKLRIDYNEAKKIIDDMYESGYIIQDANCSYRYVYNGNVVGHPSFCEDKEELVDTKPDNV